MTCLDGNRGPSQPQRLWYSVKENFFLYWSLPLFVLDHANFFVPLSPAQDKSSWTWQFISLVFKHIFTGKGIQSAAGLGLCQVGTPRGFQPSEKNTKLISCQAFGSVPDLCSEANFWLKFCILMPDITLNTTDRASEQQVGVFYWFQPTCAR